MTAITTDKLMTSIQPTWCPGCGALNTLSTLKQALVGLELQMEELTIVFGIGCSGNTADFIRGYGLHALHGRSIANAIGIKLANHHQKVLVIGGDGDIYGEGLSHLIAACRGNHDITVLVLNNHRYSLTTGQVSPTSDQGTIGKSTPTGVIEIPIGVLGTAIINGAGFVARASAGKTEQLSKLIKEGMLYEGFSLIDVQQPCLSFNKKQDYAWYQEHTYDLDESYDPTNQGQALMNLLDQTKLSLGVLYRNDQRPAYHRQISQLSKQSLVEQFPKEIDLTQAMTEFV